MKGILANEVGVGIDVLIEERNWKALPPTFLALKCRLAEEYRNLGGNF